MCVDILLSSWKLWFRHWSGLVWVTRPRTAGSELSQVSTALLLFEEGGYTPKVGRLCHSRGRLELGRCEGHGTS